MRAIFSWSMSCKHLAAALLFAVTFSAQAVTLCIGSCPVIVTEYPEIIQIESPLVVINRGSLLQLMPEETADGWRYKFSSMQSLAIVLPFFADSQVSAVVTPAGWNFETGSEDILGLGHGAGYMRWAYDRTSTLGDQGTIFGFTSAFAPGLSTYRITLDDLSTIDVWGVNIALSPMALAAGITTAVPEPATYMLMLLGLIVVAFARRRNSCKRSEATI